MPDLVDLIDRLQTLTDDGDAAEAAAVHTAVGRDVADLLVRMRRCTALLQRGLRTEAVHAARMPPALLTAADYLAGSHWRACIEAQRAAGRTLPAGFEDEEVRALRHATADEERVAPLLRRYRALALARAAASERHAALRALLGAESNPRLWDDERRRLEPAVHREAETLLRSASPGDAERAATMIDHDDWVIAPERVLRERAAVLSSATRRENAFAAFPFADLAAAQAASDIEACAALLDRWHALLEGLGTTVPPWALPVVRAASAWLAGEIRRRDTAVRRPIGPVVEAAPKMQEPAKRRLKFW